MTAPAVGPGRAVEVLHDRGPATPAGPGQWAAGSGYLIGGRLVLTAAHIVGYRQDLGHQEQLLVRTIAGRELAARVVLVCDEPSQVDLALLEISDPRFGEDLRPAGFARVNRDSPAPVPNCWAVGFPRFGEAGPVLPEGSRRETWHVGGEILPGRKLRAGLLSLQVTSTPQPLPVSVSGSAWEGMSGAVVFNTDPHHGELAVGVAAMHHRPEGESALTVVPITALAGLAGAADWWHLLGVTDPDTLPVLPSPRAASERRSRLAGERAMNERLRFRLPRVVAHFTGRDDLLAQLDAALGQRRAGVITQAISGLGGVGKTQLAAAYVAAHQDEFDIAAWVQVRADDDGTTDLADLAVALGLPVAGRTLPERAGDVLVFLSNTDCRWLLVFDNAPGPRALAALPSSGHGKVIVTSRYRGGYDAFGEELAVDVFAVDIARRYLLARSGRTHQETGDAAAVAAALGYLPLALAHAGAYCAAETGITFGEYLELLEGLPSQELFDANLEVFYQHTVAATWNTSITAAGRRAPKARRALEMAAYLAPEAIPRSFFSVLAEDSAPGRKQVADALVALHRYSLATVAGDQISVHRLVQKVIRDQLSALEQESAATHALTAIQRAMPEDSRLPATWPQWQVLVPHVVSLASIETVADLNAAQLVGTLNPVCRFLAMAGSTLLALELATRGVSVSTRILGPEHPDTLVARHNLAGSYGLAGRTGPAITILEQVNLALSYWSAGRIGKPSPSKSGSPPTPNRSSAPTTPKS